MSLVCTSREPLQVAGEHVWRLGSFEGQAARIELFTQRAWASGAAVSDESVARVDRLCNALDGLPLAIELAATQAGSTSMDDLVRIAEQGTDDLARRGGEPRQRSLDAVLAWSLDRLPPPRRNALLVLSALPGRFGSDMAREVLAAAGSCDADAVRMLARASLIDLDGETYRLLDTIRHAARRMLADDAELAAAARSALREWAQRQATRGFRSAVRHDDVSVDHYLALETALAQGVEDGAAGLGELWDLIRAMTFYRETSSTATALARGLVLGDRVPRDLDEALCFTNALQILLLAGQLDATSARLEEIAAASDALGVSYGTGYLHIYLCYFYTEFSPDEASARRHADAYLPFAESDQADALDRRYVYLLRVWASVAGGVTEESLLHAERNLAAARSVRSDVDLDTAYCQLAEVLLQLGRAEEALPHAAESARLSTGVGPQRRAALGILARTQALLGDRGAVLATARDYEADLRASGRSDEEVQAELALLREQVSELSR